MENKSKWIVWLIIILMLFSTVGLFFSGLPPAPSNPSLNPNLPVEPVEPEKRLNAESIEAKVIEVFPTLLLGGSTQEADITLIDAQVQQSFSGIQNIESSYSSQSDLANNKLIYLATLSLQPGIRVEDAVVALNANVPLLSELSANVQGVVELPSMIEFTDSETNQAVLIDLDNPFVQTLLYPETRKDHRIRVTLSGVFKGKTPLRLVALELENITLTPQPKTITLQAPLAQLEPRLAFEGTMPFSTYASKEYLQQLLQKIQGVISVEAGVLPQDNALQVNMDANVLADKNQSDWNNLFSSIPGVQATVLTGTQTLALFLDGDANTVNIQHAVLQLLQGETVFFQEPQPTPFFADVNISTPMEGVPAAGSAVKKAFSENGWTSVSFQYASLDVNALTDGNTAYAWPSGKLPTLVQPGHAVGDVISVQVDFQVIDGNAFNAIASEPVQPEQNN